MNNTESTNKPGVNPYVREGIMENIYYRESCVSTILIFDFGIVPTVLYYPVFILLYFLRCIHHKGYTIEILQFTKEEN